MLLLASVLAQAAGMYTIKVKQCGGKKNVKFDVTVLMNETAYLFRGKSKKSGTQVSVASIEVPPMGGAGVIKTLKGAKRM